MNLRHAHPEAGSCDHLHGDEAFNRDAYLDELERQRRIALARDELERDSGALGDAYRAAKWDADTFRQDVIDILADRDEDKLARIRSLVHKDTLRLSELEIDRG